MKHVMIAVAAFSATSQAMGSGGGDQTPYQKMEALYNEATPMQLGQFLLPNDPAITAGNCVGAKRNTTVAELTPLNSFPARVQGTVVISPGDPGTPPDGPLFPGTPGSPEQDATVDMIFMVPNDGSFNASPEIIGTAYTAQKVQVSLLPGVSQTFLNNADDPTSTVTMIFRISGDMIVVKQVATQASYQATLFDYFYCYQQ